MASVSDKKVVLSNQDAERIKEAEKRLKNLDTKDETKSTPTLIPIESSAASESFKNLSFKITDVKTLAKTSTPQVGRPKKIRYKTLPNGQQIKIVPKRRQSLMNGPSPLTKRLPSRSLSSHSSLSGSFPHRATPSRLPPNRVSMGSLSNRSVPSRIPPPNRASLPNRILPPSTFPKRLSSDGILHSRPSTSPLKRLSLTVSGRPMPNMNVHSGPIESTSIKIEPDLTLVQNELPSPTCTGVTKITRKEKLISSSPPPTPISEPASVSNAMPSNKRKSHHVIKPISEITFEESVEVERNENTELMEYVACLRVALNNLLSEVDVGHLELPGAIGKVKVFEKVEEMLKERNQITDDVGRQEEIELITNIKQEIDIKIEKE